MGVAVSEPPKHFNPKPYHLKKLEGFIANMRKTP